jgi:tRNA(adenine34) deaminase
MVCFLGGYVSTAHSDYPYMHEALMLAKAAASQDEVPIGAIVVDKAGDIIGRGYNTVEGSKSQLAHAEIQAIKQATEYLGDWRLDGCTLYVTIAPCTMCFGLIKLSRLDRLVYGAQSPRFGCQLDKVATSSVYKRTMIISSGIYQDEAQTLLKQFFQKQRKKKGEYKITRSSQDQRISD